MDISIKNKTFVITGSSKGIGHSLAIAIANEGANVVINFNKSKYNALNLYEEIKANNGKCIVVKADITQEDQVKYLYNRTILEFGQVDILINNAGICDDSSLQEMDYKQWLNVINVNLNGCYLCSKYFSKNMIKNNKGKIFNIASIKGQLGSKEQINYSTSKAAILGFTKSLAKELGDFNICVNSICPGFILTDLNRNNKLKLKIAKEKSILNIESSLNDLINFLIYSSSDKFNGISGQVFNLDSRIL